MFFWLNGTYVTIKAEVIYRNSDQYATIVNYYL